MMTVSRPARWLSLLRWCAALLTVAALHGGFAWVVLTWRPANAEAAAGAPEPAVLIELAALSVAPEAPTEALPPAPTPVAPDPTPPEPVKDTIPSDPPPSPPDPNPEPPPPEPTPVQAPEPEIKLPDLPVIPDALAVLQPPAPTPPPEPANEQARPVERKPPPKPRIVQRKPIERERRAAAPPPAAAPSSAPNPNSPGSAAQPSVSTASWRGTLITHLNRYKRAPTGSNVGTVQVAFSIDRSGRVLSARLSGSSGDAMLDEEAVAMIRRASPVPAPPAGLGGAVIALAVPVRFSR